MKKLESDFTNYKGKYEIQVGLIMDLVEMSKKLEEETNERDDFHDQVFEVEADARPFEDETEEEKIMLTCAQLITRIWLLEQDCLDTLRVGFNNAVE